jgi:putative sterol carrier protein
MNLNFVFVSFGKFLGTPLMPDFFLDEFLEDFSKKSIPKPHAASKQDVPAGGGAGQVDQVFKTIMAVANEEIVKKTNAVFAFQVKGAEEGQWYLDLKNGSGSAGKGESPSPPDATLIMDSQDFIKMFQGNNLNEKFIAGLGFSFSLHKKKCFLSNSTR